MHDNSTIATEAHHYYFEEGHACNIIIGMHSHDTCRIEMYKAYKR